MSRVRALWWLGGVLLLSACAKDDVTQIVVVVDSDFDGFERVKIHVDGFTMDAGSTAQLDEGPLPRRLTLVHDGGPLGPLAVEVSAFVAESDAPALVEHRTGIRFQRGKALMLKVDLLFECIGMRCAQACVAGPTCVTAEEATRLTAWDPDFMHVPVEFSKDGGAGVDVTDEGGFTPVAPDAGPGDGGGVDPIDGAAAGGSGGGGTSGSGGEGGEGGEGGGEPDAGLDPLFPFVPSNFDPEPLRGLDLMPVTLDCGTAIFDSTDLSFTDWCGDEPEVVVVEQSDASELVVLAMTSLSIEAAATLRLVGDRPVALAVLGDADVAGAIDVSAVADAPGAGAWASCPSGASPGPNASSSDAAGGGSGGGFGTPGGAGGVGYDSGISVSGGATAGNAALSPLRGGCPGGTGGNGDGTGGVGGAGGGAFQLTVAGELAISGVLLASGGAGQAGTDAQDGGGGGGSGGAILIEADSYSIDSAAVIAANGGSGAAGWPSTAFGTTSPGEDGAASTSPALGGAAAASGGDGGDGAALSSHALDGVDGVSSFISGGAGGGGGGGVGRIRVQGAASCAPSGVFSPQPSVDCPGCSAACPSAPEHGCVGADSGDAFYYLCAPEIPFTEARSKCADAGMNLVRIDDQTENDWLAARGFDSLWIGATDIVTEEDWRWLIGDEAFWSGDEGGDPVGTAFNAWESDEPSGSGDAARLVASSGEWADQDEGDDYPYVCELSP